MSRLCAGVLLLVTTAAAVVEQIHISYGDAPNSMVVSWSTPHPTPSSTVMFDKWSRRQGPLLLTASGSQEYFHQWINDTATSLPGRLYCPGCVAEYLHTVTLSSLQPGVKYAYQVNGSSAVFSFVSKPASSWAPTFAVYGDLGTCVMDENKQCDVVSPSLKRLVTDVNTGIIDGVLHVGDFAYNFMTDGGKVGAQFMRQIEPIAANVPYMTTLGNHEGGTNFAGDLQHYVKRFTMPMKKRSSNVYYSFDIGKAHIIAFSSEAYFWQLWETEKQFEFLKRDLASVDRTKTPWVITMAHRPMYCSNLDGDDCTKPDSNMRKGLPMLGARFFALEPLFKEHGVDLAFWAHEHSYERMFPVYDGTVMNGTSDAQNPYHNARAPIHIVTGAAGGEEGHDPYKGPHGPWSAVRNSAFGYGRLFVANATHLHWEEIDDSTGANVDSFWVVKDPVVKALGKDGKAAAGKYMEDGALVSQDEKEQQKMQEEIMRRTAKCLDKQGRLPGCGID